MYRIYIYTPYISYMYIRFHLSEDLLLGLCLGNGRNHRSEHWVRVSFSMAVFRDIGRGMGMRIPGLALLRCFALACGSPWGCCQCVFTGNMKGSHHLPALSSMHCLQTVRMAILSDRIGFLVVILIGTAPVIIQDAEHLVLWPFGFFPFFFFFFLKGYEED